MDLKQIALFAWMPFLAADFGCVFGGMRDVLGGDQRPGDENSDNG